MCAKPIIGLPADRRVLDPHPFHLIGEKYITAVEDGAGGMPFIIPALGGRLDLARILAHIDGLLLTGSPSNVEPHHYNGEPSKPGTLHDAERDATTFPLIEMALAEGVPILAICRGFQELNVVRGGSLHQEVHNVPGYHNHKENTDDPLDIQYGPSHEVTLVEGGMLRALAGAERMPVNSLHAQGIKKLGKGLAIEAVADDGLIEGFQVDDATGFALAVQWHPEWRVTENKFFNSIFKAFGDACSERAVRRQV